MYTFKNWSSNTLQMAMVLGSIMLCLNKTHKKVPEVHNPNATTRPRKTQRDQTNEPGQVD